MLNKLAVLPEDATMACGVLGFSYRNNKVGIKSPLLIKVIFLSLFYSKFNSTLGVSYGFKGYAVANPDEAKTPGFFYSNDEVSSGIVLYYNQSNFFQLVIYGGSGTDTSTVKARRWSNSVFGAWITLA